jgi:hypothetical protein
VPFFKIYIYVIYVNFNSSSKLTPVNNQLTLLFHFYYSNANHKIAYVNFTQIILSTELLERKGRGEEFITDRFILSYVVIHFSLCFLLSLVLLLCHYIQLYSAKVIYGHCRFVVSQPFNS